MMKNLPWSSIVRNCAVSTLAFMFLCGLIMVVWQVHPFFLDEWAIIYNIKFKSYDEVWGGLEKMQQFPRVYLQLIKAFNELTNFSYFSLRLPSFLVSLAAILYSIRLSGKLYDHTFYRWLFVLIYAAYPSSIFYFVLTKQYTMEMFLGLVAIAQFALLLNIGKGKKVPGGKYLLLCLSFLLAPLFSYTYPILIAPIFVLVLLSGGQGKAKQWLPLTFGIAGSVILYFTDIRQVMADQGMKNYWAEYYMSNGFNLKELAQHTWLYFYNFGRGPFMAFMGLLGVSSWLYGSYRSVDILRRKEKTLMEWLLLYSVMLMWLSVLLFVAGKLPLNAYRLNAYKTAAAAIMIIYFFTDLQRRAAFVKSMYAIAGFLFALQVLFIVQPLTRDFTEDAHHRKMVIYRNAQAAIAVAQQEQIPVFTTSMTLYPHEDIDQADWVIKSNPAYKRDVAVPVYPINSGDEADSLLHTMHYSSAAVTTGDSVFVLQQ